MKDNIFKIAKKLVDEHEELVSFCKSLNSNPNHKIGIIYEFNDHPGVNYVTYSDNLKELFVKFANERIKEIEKTFN